MKRFILAVLLLLAVPSTVLASTHSWTGNGYPSASCGSATTGTMLWLAVVFVWTAATILRGRRDLFAIGALVSGFAAILAVNVLNPDALIARTNLNRPNLDLPYLMQLSDDATPELVKALPTVDPKLRDKLAFELSYRQRPGQDWRTWNVSRDRAQKALENLP